MTRQCKGLRPLSQSGLPNVPRNALQRGVASVPVVGSIIRDDDKYLNSYARMMRGFVRAIDRRSALGGVS